MGVQFKPMLSIWMYRDSGGDVILARLIEELQQEGISTFSDFDMRRCYCKNGRVYTADGFDLSSVRVLFHMNADEQTEYQRYILKALENSGVTLVNSFSSFDTASDKFTANQILRRSGFSVPDSRLIYPTISPDVICELFQDWKSVIVKPRYSFGGKGIIRFNDVETFTDFLGVTKNCCNDLYLEKFIPFHDHDYRVEVISGEPIGTYSRGLSHSFKTNMSASKDKIRTRFMGLLPREEHERMGVGAARALGLDCTVVDMIESIENGMTYILEVNCQLGIFVEEANRVMGIPAYGERPYQYSSDQKKLKKLVEFLSRRVNEVYANV